MHKNLLLAIKDAKKKIMFKSNEGSTVIDWYIWSHTICKLSHNTTNVWCWSTEELNTKQQSCFKKKQTFFKNGILKRDKTLRSQDTKLNTSKDNSYLERKCLSKPKIFKESTYQRRLRFDPWVGKTLWRRKWQSAPIFLPGKSLG